MFVIKRGNYLFHGCLCTLMVLWLLDAIICLLSLCCIDGRQERVLFDKITSRINKLCNNLNANYIDPPKIAQKVLDARHTRGTAQRVSPNTTLIDSQIGGYWHVPGYYHSRIG